MLENEINVQKTHAQIELAVFSGKNNPSWKLSHHQIKVLFNRLKELPELSEEIPPKHGLGYRGLIVHLREKLVPRRITVTIFNNRVRIQEESSLKVYADENRESEKWLLNTGIGVIDPHLADKIKALIQ